ncbi:MAG: MlaD family protein, partial [Pseudomonadota bacterium]
MVAALSVAWQNWSQKGPLIEVVFAEADGLEAGKTELRYRDIAVGLVEELRFSDDLASVIASIRLENDLAAFVDSDAMFWIVRPEVTAQGVSGLDTVLSGVYIAGAWDDEAGERNSQFAGLEAAPLIPLGETGIVFTLRSETELPPYGTPVLYKGVQVGRIGPAVLDDGGLTVSAPVAILAPHDQLITSATRFWDISGIDFSLGVGGAQLDFDSLASLIAGGVTFDTLGSGGTAVSEDAVFTLYPDEDAARDEFLVTSDGGTVDVVAIFDENLPGLQTGAAVMLGGLRLGQVTAISGVIDPDQFGDNQARLRAVLRLNPGRLNLDTS